MDANIRMDGSASNTRVEHRRRAWLAPAKAPSKGTMRAIMHMDASAAAPTDTTAQLALQGHT